MEASSPQIVWLSTLQRRFGIIIEKFCDRHEHSGIAVQWNAGLKGNVTISLTVATQTCKTVTRQFHRNCESFSLLATIIGLRYERLTMFLVHRTFRCKVSNTFLPIIFNICFGRSKEPSH